MCTRAEFLGAILEFCIPYKLFKNSLKMFIIFFLMDAFCSYDAEKKIDKVFNKLFTEFSNISELYG